MKVTFEPEECRECGSEKLAAGDLKANGREWKCRQCGNEFMADDPPSEDDYIAPNTGEKA